METPEPSPSPPPEPTPAGASGDDAAAAVRADLAAHGDELFHVVRSALGDDELAAEVVQDVFVRAWHAHDRFDPTVASRRTWLFAIARNATVDAVRSRRRQPAPAVVEADAGPEVPDDARLVADRLALRTALRSLSADHRTALLEVHVHGRPHREVAEELGVPEGTVRSRVFYALRQLRSVLIDQGWTHE